MAMAKPINSLQFIFLNHLSSHEKIFIKVTPSKCSACIRSLIVSAGLHWHCALIVIPTEWPPRIVAEGWEKFDHILYLPCCIQPGWHGSGATDPTPWWHLLWHLIKWRLMRLCCCHGHRMWDDQALEVTVLVVRALAWQLLMCSVYGATTCDGKCSQRGN